MDAIDLLMSDHREVEKLFAHFDELGDERAAIYDKRACAAEICKALKVHTTIEEELFYPAALAVFDDEDDELVAHAEDEHSEAKSLIHKIESADEAQLDKLVAELKKAIEHHVGDEEDEMFPKLRELRLETVKLGERMQARKTQLTYRAA